MSNPFLVFGTGRSGTSFVSGVLHKKLGVKMGNEFVPAGKNNPDGYWEDVDFHRLNKDFVSGRLDWTKWLDEVCSTMTDRAKSGEPWGFKSSEMSYVLGIYMSLIDKPMLIWCRRDKDLVIESCYRCYGREKDWETTIKDRYKLIRNALQGRDHLIIDFHKERRTEDEVAREIAHKFRDPIKLYFAILNKGWLRREITSRVLPQIEDTPGVEVTFEDPALTWHHPISSNRNLIVQRFLKTDCDYLMMLDDDVIPLNNPALFVFAGKDVVGFPAKVRQSKSDRQLNWVAYLKDDRVGYTPIDFAKVDPSIELLQVDAIGTGCILVKREVLENIKAPFHIKFDENGILTRGTDFAFCERAREAGYEVFTTPKRVCEHFKELGMLDMNSYNDSDGVDPAAAKYGIPWGGMAIMPVDWEFIKKIIVKNGSKHVLEFGSGLSSLLMSELTNVDSYENDDKWVENITAKANGNNLSIYHTDDDLVGHDYDLVFIDGPRRQEIGGPGREDSYVKAAHFDRIIVHDAGKAEEQELQEKYLSKDYTLKDKNGWHKTRCQYWVKNGL
jgi:hypothetical protein